MVAQGLACRLRGVVSHDITRKKRCGPTFLQQHDRRGGPRLVAPRVGSPGTWECLGAASPGKGGERTPTHAAAR